MNPVQIFGDLDNHFIQQSQLTKGDLISQVWKMHPKPGERLSSFYARLDNACLQLASMFNHTISLPDKFAIIQKNAPTEFLQTFLQMLQNDRPLQEICQTMIALENVSARRQAHAMQVDKFNREMYDRQHYYGYN